MTLLVGPVLGQTAPRSRSTSARRSPSRPPGSCSAAGARCGSAPSPACSPARPASRPSGAGPSRRSACRGTPAILPEALLGSLAAGLAAGLLGALVGSALRGGLPRPAVARTVAAGALAHDRPGAWPTGSTRGASGAARPPAIAPAGGAGYAVRLDPSTAADDAAWLQVTAWQGGGLVVDRLAPTPGGSWRTTRPIPFGGDWKVMLRLQRGRAVAGVPIALPADAAIPVGAVPRRRPRGPTRAFVPDRTLLQRERKGDIPPWLWADGLRRRAGARARLPRRARLGAGPGRALERRSAAARAAPVRPGADRWITAQSKRTSRRGRPPPPCCAPSARATPRPGARGCAPRRRAG